MLAVTSRRKVICAFARTPPGYGIPYAQEFFPDVRSFMPPQGMLTIAAYLPPQWDVRMVDENVHPLTDEDFAWADVVLATGTHVQRHSLAEIAERAHRVGKLAVIGGPSASACPEHYPTFDIVHIGEIGDATDALIMHLDRTVDRPPQQLVFTTKERLPLDQFPIPSYDRIDFLQYFVGTIQFSSGCPFTCEFCDIPELYGRNPRYKSPARIIAELDTMVAKQPVSGIFFVDDNLIGNKKAFRKLLPFLIDWQKKHDYQVRFAGECTLNLAMDRELLALMREANFTDIFFGIESPDEETLHSIDKDQNVRMPLLEAISVINSYGIELSAGMIFGFDNDGEELADKMIKFIDRSQIPFVKPNILTALPKTPLWRRLQKEGRLIEEAPLEELNVRYTLGQEKIFEMWRKVIDWAYSPESLHRRLRHQIVHTYPNRKQLPMSRFDVTWPLLQHVGTAVSRIAMRLGVNGNYRKVFWRTTLDLIRTQDLPQFVYMFTLGHHFIRFGEEVGSGQLLTNYLYGPHAREERPDAVPWTPAQRGQLRVLNANA